MATTSNPEKITETKGKMIAVGPEVTGVANMRPTDYNKIIEVIVYRKWTSKHVQTRQPTKFCCILMEKQSTPIQANMDVKDAEYFNQLLQLQRAYRISGENGLWRIRLPLYLENLLTSKKYQVTVSLNTTSILLPTMNFQRGLMLEKQHSQ
ncbi:hypothetical protein Tco_1207410, partial [Tanacetum coccineum]